MADKATDIFCQLDKPDEITTTVFFNACAEMKDEKMLDLARTVFSQLLQSVFNMFCRSNDLPNAEHLFEQINRNVIAYGLLMKAYNDQDQSEKTLQLWEQMKRHKVQGN